MSSLASTHDRGNICPGWIGAGPRPENLCPPTLASPHVAPAGLREKRSVWRFVPEDNSLSSYFHTSAINKAPTPPERELSAHLNSWCPNYAANKPEPSQHSLFLQPGLYERGLFPISLPQHAWRLFRRFWLAACSAIKHFRLTRAKIRTNSRAAAAKMETDINEEVPNCVTFGEKFDLSLDRNWNCSVLLHVGFWIQMRLNFFLVNAVISFKFLEIYLDTFWLSILQIFWNRSLNLIIIFIF